MYFSLHKVLQKCKGNACMFDSSQKVKYEENGHFKLDDPTNIYF